MKRNIAVIFGGISNEHEISIITGTMAANILKNGGDTVIPLYITPSNEIYTGDGLTDINSFRCGGYMRCNRAQIALGGIYVLSKRGRFKKFVKLDAALNCCHGGAGEGGGISGLCAMNSIPLASAGMFESAAFMDKYYTKLVLSSLGVKTASFAYIRGLNELESAKLPAYPLIVKPAKLGSSIGIERADNEDELRSAVQAALYYDDGILIEEYISGRREINCAAYFSEGKVFTSECEEAITAGDILSYDDKYAGGGRSELPANIPEPVSCAIKNTTAKVYSKLNMRGIVRFDYILSGEEIYLSEINTVPGSLSYYLLSKGFKDFYPVLQAVIVQALEDDRLKKEKKILSTGILNCINGNAVKNMRK